MAVRQVLVIDTVLIVKIGYNVDTVFLKTIFVFFSAGLN